MDKACSVSENGAVTASFTYDVDGQIATAKTHATGKQESFLWDGLALIHRGGTSYINEPYVTGGNPILAEDKVLFNDMLGTTLGVHSEKYEPIARDAFGMTSKDADSAENFFTGKPYIGELSYTFLFRNYRPEQGKWQTTDPLGYPDGWNNFAYVNNGVIYRYDLLGGTWSNYNFGYYYFFRDDPSPNDYVDISQMGLMVDVYNKIADTLFYQVRSEIDNEVQAKILSQGGESGTFSGSYEKSKGVSCGDICFAMGNGTVFFRLSYSGSYSPFTDFTTEDEYYIYDWVASGEFEYFDTFKDPVDLRNWWEEDLELPGGTPYDYGHTWKTVSQIKIQGGLVKCPE